METSISNNRRIAKNTLLLYVRQIFTLCLSLYTSRLTLQVLGASDFGVYAAVGGITALLSVITSSMSTSTQRFITFELGTGNKERLNRVFNTSVQIHALLALVLMVLAETVGVWYVDNHLVIAPERHNVAFWVFQVSAMGCAFSLLNVPNTASIVAHEDMGTFALFSIVDAVLKLAAVAMLFVISWDKLFVYAVSLLLIQLLNQSASFLFCRFRYAEVRFRRMFDIALVRQMFGLAGWNVISNLAIMGFIQGVNILLNLFFGPVMNAAYTVAMQAYSGLRSFCSSFQLASNPQIVKLYSSGELEKMRSLVIMVCKMSFFLIFFLSLPFLVNADYVLSLWLVEVPAHSVSFFTLLLVYAYFDVMVYPMDIAAQATGRVKRYNSITSLATLAILPLSYIGFLLGWFPESIYVIAICMSLLGLPLRLWCLNRLIGLGIGRFLRQVFLKIIGIGAVSSVVPLVFHYILPVNLLTVAADFLLAFLSAGLSIYLLGLSLSERQQVRSAINKVKSKIRI